MADGLIVFLMGVIGGCLASLLDALDPLRKFAKDAERVNWRSVGIWTLVAVIVALCGGAASWIVWALYTHVNVGTGVDLPLVAESLIVGLGGVGALRRYLHESTESTGRLATLEEALETVKAQTEEINDYKELVNLLRMRQGCDLEW